MKASRRLGYLALAATVLTLPRAAADSTRSERLLDHRLIRQAEQLAEAGALAASTGLLERVLAQNGAQQADRPTQRRARSLLATNYFESGVYREAIRHAQAVLPTESQLAAAPGPGLLEHAIECRLLLAESHHELGDADLAEAHCRAAAELFKSRPEAPSIRRLRQRVSLLTLQEAIGSQAEPVSEAPPDFAGFPEEHYARAVRTWVEGLSDRGLHAEAVATLDRIGLPDLRVSQSLGFRTLAELHGLKMKALSQQQRQSGNRSLERLDESATAARRVLNAWHRDLVQRARSTQEIGIAHLQELADLSSLEADWCERRATDLMRRNPPDAEASQTVWSQAAATLDRLQKLVGVLTERATKLEKAGAEAAGREAVQHFAEQRLDRALSGFQRVLIRLRERDGSLPDWQQGLLDRASSDLIALRGRRLLRADPRRLEAYSARAFVLASTGSHEQAIPEFRATLEEPVGTGTEARFARAQASLGLGMSLLATHRLAEAGEHLSLARTLLNNESDRSSRATRLDHQSGAALGYLAMLQGDYRVATERLNRLSDAGDQTEASENDSVRSTAKVFLALLRKAEADYAAARRELSEGRRLSKSPFVGRRHETAYDLAEAALLLSEASAASGGAERRERIAGAERLLAEIERRAEDRGQASLNRPIAVLRSQLFALRGDSERAKAELAPLTQDADPITRARAYLGLSRLERMTGNSDPATLQAALGSADGAVAALQTMADRSPEQAYPSLTFQANSEAAWLLDALDRSGVAPSDNDSPPPEGVRLASLDAPPSWGEVAIERLEAAVRIAERPTTENTRDNQGRSQFFTRYAPAYDLLVSQLVRSAERERPSRGAFLSAALGEPGYDDLVRAMEVSDLARNRTFRESVGVDRNATAPASGWLANRLPDLVRDNEALLVYHLGGMRWRSKRYDRLAGTDGEGLLFVVTEGGTRISCHKLTTADNEGGAKRLSRSAASRVLTPYLDLLRQSPRQRGDILTSHRTVAAACTQAVMPESALAAIAPSRGIQRLVIVPDGMLHQLPFEALLRRVEGRRWAFGLDWLPPITYGPSLSVLGSLSTERTAPAEWNKVVSIGAPVYSRSGFDGADPPVPLAHAEAEIAGVLRAFGSSTRPGSLVRRTGADATEATLLREARDASVLHIAAHGFASRSGSGVDAYLAMTPGDHAVESDDGVVRLGELSALPLDGCELAILSACKTQVGADRPLEVGMSLTRALLEQQARRVVSSHWEVADRATSLLVPSFCETLVAAGDGAAGYGSALRLAKQRLRSEQLDRHGRKRYSDPYYWAPLVLVGAR